MKVFTINESNQVSHGAAVEELELKNGIKIPVVAVGQTGRGRQRSILPVEGAQPGDTLEYASLASTMKGGTKLRSTGHSGSDECILVLRTGMGFRGGSHVTYEMAGEDIGEELCPSNGVLCSGVIADGAAGRMGNSRQYILRLPAMKVLSIHLYGRMYGRPDHYYARFNGNTVECVPAEERELLDW